MSIWSCRRPLSTVTGSVGAPTQPPGKGTLYLFNHKALAKVFRAKMLAGIEAAGLALPPRHPSTWVVDCKSVGSGEKALAYLGRYLYRGVIREKDIERNESVPGLTSVPQDRRILLYSAGRDKVGVETPNQVNGRAT